MAIYLFSVTYELAIDMLFYWQEFKKAMILRLTIAMMLAAGASFAIDPPQNCPNPGQQQGKGQGQGQGQMKGKRSGPRDGSGPIHSPGTGGGSGAGNRGGGQRGGGRK